MPFETFHCPPVFDDLKACYGKIDLVFSSKGTQPIPQTLKSQVELACPDFSNPSAECKSLLNNMTVVTGFPMSGSIEHLAACMELPTCTCGAPGADHYCSGNTPCKHNNNSTCHQKETSFGKDVCPAGTTECQDRCVWGSTILLDSSQRGRLRLVPDLHQ